MKTKLVGVLVITLLIATMAIPISAINKVNVHSPEPSLIYADAPIWQVNDSWTYEAEILENSDENASRVVNSIGEVTWTVVDDSGDIYILEGTVENFTSITSMGLIGFRSTKLASINAELRVRKADLGLIQYSYHIKGILLLTIFGIPLPIPVQMESWKTSEFNPTWKIIPFPLFDGKSGTIENSINSEEWSYTLFWGLIPITEGSNSWGFGELGYTCNAEQITVPADTYDVYNVSIEGYHTHYRTYYSPEVGNSVKQSIYITFEDGPNLYHSEEMVLKSTNYIPPR